jgi:hypothetical protein
MELESNKNQNSENPSQLQAIGAFFWDLIKMDCEGAEYGILQSMTSPLAKQMSVEFHEHTPARKGESIVNDIFVHLSQWYVISGNEKKALHGCESNYWDVLFTLRQI